MSALKVAFLYTEVAGYFLACANELSKDADVLIFRWPVNKEAPFDLSDYDHLQLLDRSEFTQEELEKKLTQFAPDILVCSGWMDKGYVKAARTFKKKIPVVVALDNHWNGTIKQRIAAMISPLYLKRIYTHAWVPGVPQAEYARKLGFRPNHILSDYYCADTQLFDQQYQQTFADKRIFFPKRFLYVARYSEHKGIFEMWEAFSQLQAEHPNEWELWCIGTGDEWENRVQHEKIKHFGFVQPKRLKEFVAQTGVYILPSKFEPWGVAVQEFAITGLPLLLSDQIGAKWSYLKEGVNGFSFRSDSVLAIKEAMFNVIKMNDKELIKMGEQSHEIGMRFDPNQWSAKIRSLVK